MYIRTKKINFIHRLEICSLDVNFIESVLVRGNVNEKSADQIK